MRRAHANCLTEDCPWAHSHDLSEYKNERNGVPLVILRELRRHLEREPTHNVVVYLDHDE